jgi:hypothetical protein
MIASPFEEGLAAKTNSWRGHGSNPDHEDWFRQSWNTIGRLKLESKSRTGRNTVMAEEPVAAGERATTTSQLRAAIDAGQTRDKVNYPDPAAAPLGTDDEAAGNPPTPEQVSLEPIPAPPAREAVSDWTSYLLLAVPVAIALLIVAALA